MFRRPHFANAENAQKRQHGFEIFAALPLGTHFNVALSNDIARRNGARLLNLSDVPVFINLHADELKEIEYFEKFGNVWFYINGTGTERSGTYKINHEGPTAFEQMHKEEWLQLPFAQRAQFCSGPMALKACIYGNGFNEKHVLISGAKVIREAPIVVMKRTLMDRQTDTAKHVSILRRDRHAASTNLSVVE